MGLKGHFIEQAKRANKRVVFPEGADERIQKAAEVLKKEGIASPVLIGNTGELTSLASQRGIDLTGIDIIDPVSSPLRSDLVLLYSESRKVKQGVAERILRKDIVFGGMLLASGNVDAMVAGAATTTASVIQAAALTVGYATGISTPSSFL
ncbi:MAG: phosphate acyltransferase, partial [Candidatus Ratteibacteria bacterium]|nr:phosphate acyltransferase [Candidatus Ratteibacteria bacterium]